MPNTGGKVINQSLIMTLASSYAGCAGLHMVKYDL